MKFHHVAACCALGALLALSGTAQAGISLGFGTASLIGNDLTDPGEENGATVDGVVTANIYTVGTEGGAGEHSYRLFDNGVNPPPPNPAHDQAKSKLYSNNPSLGSVTFQFSSGPQVVRSYTLSTANDTPNRDPSAWNLLGSNDGVSFTPISTVSGNTWSTTRHQVQLFSGLGNDTAYSFMRFEPTSTAGLDLTVPAYAGFQMSELEFFSFDATTTGTPLGTGAGSLLGGDLTDPENDGTTDGQNYNAIFSSDNEPGFGGGEFSFNVFNNTLGGGIGKWCCDDASPGDPINGPGHQLDADFGQPVELTHFTVSSSNDSEGRDPRIWSIEGSNDGINWDIIFFHAGEEGQAAGDIWGTTRDQVVRFDAGVDFPVPGDAYTILRYSVKDSVNGDSHALGEIEYFGTIIPEPGSLTLLGLGMGLVLLMKRTRSKRNS